LDCAGREDSQLAPCAVRVFSPVKGDWRIPKAARGSDCDGSSFERLMPTRIAAGCQHPSRCPQRATNGNYCAAHAKQRDATYEQQRGTAADRGYDYRWAKISSAVLQQQPVCADPFGRGCGNASAHTDHIIPKRQGGSDARSNLQGLCSGCHSAKTLLEQKVKFTLLCQCPTLTRVAVTANEVVVSCDAHSSTAMVNSKLWPRIHSLAQ
jgi:5-methylcytosine-specific restriction protein A